VREYVPLNDPEGNEVDETALLDAAVCETAAVPDSEAGWDSVGADVDDGDHALVEDAALVIDGALVMLASDEHEKHTSPPQSTPVSSPSIIPSVHRSVQTPKEHFCGGVHSASLHSADAGAGEETR
jgi:hypothetical protein